MDERFAHKTYLIRKKFFKFLGAAFHVYDSNGAVVLYSRQKAFKLKEDIRLYTGEDMQTEVLCIRARQVLDFSAAYDVVDSSTGQKVGALKRKGFKSILRDEWILMDREDRDIGLVQEDNAILALVRRFLTRLIPQSFTVTVNGRPVADIKQHFNPIILKVTADFAPDAQGLLDRRLGLAAAILLCAIEGRQE